MIKTPDYTHIADTGKELTDKARDVWNDRTQEERSGLLAALVGLLIVGLVTMVWRAGRSASSRYVETPSRDDDWF